MRFLLVLFLLVALPGPGKAWERLALSGEVTLGLTGAGQSLPLARIDMTASLPLTRPGGAPLGFELGLNQYLKDTKRPHETYAALVWNDRWRLGVVRPAYDSVVPSVFDEAVPQSSYETRAFVLSRATLDAMTRTEIPLGVSADWERGPLRGSVSAHYALRGEATLASAALAWSQDGLSLAAAAELVLEAHGRTRANLKAGLRLRRRVSDLSLSLLAPRANSAQDALQMAYWHRLSPRLWLGAMTHRQRGPGSRSALALRYGAGRLGTWHLAVTDEPGGPALHASVGWRF